MREYGVAVIGSGPAGIDAARAARRLGRQVVILERGQFGGTCLNEGCIPSNAILETLDRTTGSPEDRLRDAFRAAQRVVPAMRKGLYAAITAAGIDVIAAEAVGLTPGAVVLADGSTVRADAVIVATGGRTTRPEVEGADLPCCLTWADCQSIERVPASVVVVAGGPLALESVRFFRSLDARVTLIPGAGPFIPLDSEIEEFLLSELERYGVSVRPGAVVRRVVSATGGATLMMGDGSTIEAEAVVWADFRVARRGPLFDSLESVREPAADLAVFVCGDATGRTVLASEAKQQGIGAGHAAVGAEWWAQPTVCAVHGQPEVASVGATEAMAREGRTSVLSGYAEYGRSARAFALGRADGGVVKLVADPDTGLLLGGQVVGPAASELAAIISLAMASETSVEMIADAPMAHPSLMELVSDAAREIRQGEPAT